MGNVEGNTSVEQKVQALLAGHSARGRRDEAEIDANAAADDMDKPSTEWGLVPDIARVSDLAAIRGRLEGMEAALLLLGRRIDARIPG